MSNNFQDKKVLVTGGAGFIGSHLVDCLMAAGSRVRVLDNLINGSLDNLRQHAENDKFEFVQGSIVDEADVAKAMQGIDMVFHLACLGVRHSIKHPFENHRVNAEGTLLILQKARAEGIKKFIHCSSSEIYGTAVEVPMKESHPARPCTVYGASKLAGEAYALAFHQTYGFNTTVVRPFNTYGPRSHFEGDAGEMIPKSIVRSLAGESILVFGDGSQTRDFTYVEDTARGVLQAAESDELTGKTVNLGSHSELSIKEVAETIKKLSQNSAPVNYEKSRPGDVLRLYADTSLLTRVTGWEPRVPFSQGLEKTIDWFKSAYNTNANLLKDEIAFNWE